jgi:hypothetical protein
VNLDRTSALPDSDTSHQTDDDSETNDDEHCACSSDHVPPSQHRGLSVSFATDG